MTQLADSGPTVPGGSVKDAQEGQPPHVTGMALPMPLVLHTRPALEMDDEQFFAFCQQNREYRIECSAEGDLIIMSPVGGETGDREAELIFQLRLWAKKDGPGVAFGASTGFILPNKAKRAPDAAWVRRERLAALSPRQKKRFLPLCPDFVAEVLSPFDSLPAAQEKMEEYRDNGARLGWLIDPDNRHLYIYRPNAPVERLDDPATVPGDPELPSFVLHAQAIFDLDW